MPIILSIETSGPTGSVALVQDGKCLGTNIIYKSFSHSATLGVACEQLLENLGIKTNQLNAIALSNGPGSFTGLRIGASYAKGLCFGLGIPLIPIPTHLVMATQIIPFIAQKSIVIAMQDARRMEVYQTIYEWNGQQLIELVPCTNYIIEKDGYQQYLANNPCYFLGDGATKLQNILSIEESVFSMPSIVPLAETLGLIAEQKLGTDPVVDLASYVPFYLKPWIGQAK